MKRRLLAIATAILVGAGIPLIATALPAQAINCQFGDQFWQFHSDLSLDYTATVAGLDHNGHPAQFLGDVAGGGSLYCQTAGTQYPNGTAYEWVQKNTANCLTYDIADGDGVRLQPCAGLSSQYWQLINPLGGYEDWGGVVNEYGTGPSGTPLGLWDQGNASSWDRVYCYAVTIPSGCQNAHTTAFHWTLFGPYK